MGWNDRGGSRIFVDSHKRWRKKDFTDCFLAEMRESSHDLPLQDMCISGGSPAIDDAEVEGLKIFETIGMIVRGSFHVSFIEESPTGCRDMQWSDRRKGEISFTLNLSDGYVEFDSPRLRREYEPDEF